MNPLKSILVLTFTVSVTACSGVSEDEVENTSIKSSQQKLLDNTSSVDHDFLTGFDACAFSDAFFEKRKHLIVNTTPVHKHEGFLSYQINTSFNHGKFVFTPKSLKETVSYPSFSNNPEQF